MQDTAIADRPSEACMFYESCQSRRAVSSASYSARPRIPKMLVAQRSTPRSQSRTHAGRPLQDTVARYGTGGEVINVSCHVAATLLCLCDRASTVLAAARVVPPLQHQIGCQLGRFGASRRRLHGAVSCTSCVDCSAVGTKTTCPADQSRRARKRATHREGTCGDQQEDAGCAMGPAGVCKELEHVLSLCIRRARAVRTGVR